VSQRNPDLIEEFYPREFVWHEPDRDIRGYEQAKQFVSTFFEAFPDINISVEDVIAEGDKVVSRYTIRGTHQGDLEDVGPVTVTGPCYRELRRILLPRTPVNKGKGR
jgi:predicted ester cyclase